MLVRRQISNGYLIPRLNELGEIGFKRIVGNTRERHAVANTHLKAGENNVADARNGFLRRRQKSRRNRRDDT